MTSHNIYTLNDSSATLLSPPNTHSGVDITIQNLSDTGFVYIGSEEVTVLSFGYRLSPGHAMSFELSGKDSLYAVASHSGMRVSVLNVSLETED